MFDIKDDLYKKYLYRFIDRKDISNEDWKMFFHHIETHKYYLNLNYSKEINLIDAYNSWIEYVFDPFIHIIEKNKIMKYTDLNIIHVFSKIMFEWDILKKNISKDDKHVHIYHIVEEYCLTLEKYPYYKKLIIKYISLNELRKFKKKI